MIISKDIVMASEVMFREESWFLFIVMEVDCGFYGPFLCGFFF